MPLQELVSTATEHYGVVLTLLTTLGLYAFSQKLKYGAAVPVKAQNNYFETWYWSSYIVSITHAAIVGVLSLLWYGFLSRFLTTIGTYSYF
jgi:hypothetical protein